MAVLTPFPKFRALDDNGNPLAFGKLYTYASGTNTPLVTYRDQAGLATNRNPVILNIDGEADVWVAENVPYRFRLTSATDALQWDVDPVNSATTSGTIMGHSANVAQMRLQTDPGEAGLENLATTQAGEDERLRFRIAEISGMPYWNQTGTGIRAQSMPFASLPAPGTPGRIAHITDGTRGMYVDQGTAWTKLSPLIDIHDFGGAGDGVTNNTPALNAALTAIASTGGTIYFPASSEWYLFASKPQPIYGGVSIVGDGVSRSTLVRNYTEADVRSGFLDFDVATSGLTNPCVVSGIQIRAGAGTTGGSCINVESSATVAQGDLFFEKLYITGAGTFNYGIRLDGQEKVSAPQGIRGCYLRDCIIFQYVNAGIQVLCGNSIGISKCGVYETAGVPTQASLVIDASASVDTNNVNVDMIFCPTARIGVTHNTTQVHLSIPNCTTLTTGPNCYNLTLAGNYGTIVGGPINVSSAGTGFATGGRILAGQVRAPQGAGTGKLETADGLTFPSTAISLSNPNTLDAYQEGVFTPSIVGETSAGTAVYAIREGYFTRVGNVVHVDIRLNWHSHTGAGNMLITGLPFFAILTGNYASVLSIWSDLFQVGGEVSTPIISSNFVTMFYSNPSAGTAFGRTQINSFGNIALSGTYLTAT